MPLVRVSIFTGKTPEQKKEIVDGFTDIIAKALNISKEHVWIVFDEIPKENWNIGGVSCSELYK